MAIPINSWSDFKKVLRQLKEAKAHEMYETIILDTIDIAYDYCEAYICENAINKDGGYGVDNISDIPYGRNAA